MFAAGFRGSCTERSRNLASSRGSCSPTLLTGGLRPAVILGPALNAQKLYMNPVSTSYAMFLSIGFAIVLVRLGRLNPKAHIDWNTQACVGMLMECCCYFLKCSGLSKAAGTLFESGTLARAWLQRINEPDWHSERMILLSIQASAILVASLTHTQSFMRTTLGSHVAGQLRPHRAR